MAVSAGERTTAQLVDFWGSHRAVPGLLPDQARGNRRRSSASLAAGHGEEAGGGGKSLYACTCGERGFSRRSALRRHIKEGLETPRHECPNCRRRFKRPGHVQQHLRGCQDRSGDETTCKDPLAAQKLQLRRKSGPASNAAAVVPRAGPAVVRAGFDHPGGAVEAQAVPGGSWDVPVRVSTTTATPVAKAGAPWPSRFSPQALSITPAACQGLRHVPDSDLAAYYHPAYPAEAVVHAQRQGRAANTHAPGPAGYYPTAVSGGDLSYIGLGAASVNVGPAGGSFGMTAPENSFMGNFYGFGLDSFDV